MDNINFTTLVKPLFIFLLLLMQCGSQEQENQSTTVQNTMVNPTADDRQSEWQGDMSYWSLPTATI